MSLFSRNDIENMLKSSHIGLWKLECEEGKQKRFYANDVMDALLGIDHEVTPEERTEFHLSRVHPDDLELFGKYAEALTKGYAEIIYRYIHPTEGVQFVRCSGRIDTSVKEFVCIKGMHQDITQTIHLENEKVVEQRIHEAESLAQAANQLKDEYIERYLEERRDKFLYLYQSQHDMMTKTLRKDVFLEQAKIYLQEENPQKVAVVFIDIDFFKEVNDALGHVMGDKVIADVASIIRTSVANKDLICRYGGDEFCVLMKEIPKAKLLDKLEFLNSKFQLDYGNERGEQHVTCSMGAVHYDASQGPVDIVKLIECADVCLYKVKGSGRNQFCVSDYVKQ